MDEEATERRLAPAIIQVFVAALLVALPMLLWSGYDYLRPESATVNDHTLPAFETYEAELFRDLSNRDAFLLTGYDEQKVRAMYANVAAHHTEAVRAQSVRGLVMYGALFLVSLGALLSKFKVSWR